MATSGVSVTIFESTETYVFQPPNTLAPGQTEPIE